MLVRSEAARTWASSIRAGLLMADSSRSRRSLSCSVIRSPYMQREAPLSSWWVRLGMTLATLQTTIRSSWAVATGLAMDTSTWSRRRNRAILSSTAAMSGGFTQRNSTSLTTAVSTGEQLTLTPGHRPATASARAVVRLWTTSASGFTTPLLSRASMSTDPMFPVPMKPTTTCIPSLTRRPVRAASRSGRGACRH